MNSLRLNEAEWELMHFVKGSHTSCVAVMYQFNRWTVVFECIYLPSLLFLTLSILHSSNIHINFTKSKIENDKRISVLLSMWQTKIDINIYQHIKTSVSNSNYVCLLRIEKGNTKFAFDLISVKIRVEYYKSNLILIWIRRLPSSLAATTTWKQQHKNHIVNRFEWFVSHRKWTKYVLTQTHIDSASPTESQYWYYFSLELIIIITLSYICCSSPGNTSDTNHTHINMLVWPKKILVNWQHRCQ